MDFRAMRKQLDDMLSSYESTYENMSIKHDLALSQVLKEKQRIQDELDKMTTSVNTLTREIELLKDENKSFMSVSTIVTLTNENASLKKTLAVMEKSISRRNSEQSTQARGTYLTQLLEQDKSKTVDASPKKAEPIVTLELVKEQPVQETVKNFAKEQPMQDAEQETAKEQVKEAVLEPIIQEPVQETAKEPVQEPVHESDSISTDDEPGVNLYEKKIKGVLYYVDDDENIYNVLENGEAGDIVGKYITKSEGKKKITWL